MKTIKVNHVILTLALSEVARQNAGGLTQAEVDEMINRRLGEGYDDVEVTPLRTNFDERQQATHVVNQYIFKAHQKEQKEAPAKAEKVAKTKE